LVYVPCPKAPCHTKGIKIKEEDKNNITTNSSIKPKEKFNLDIKGESEFNNAINSNKDAEYKDF
jgi:hypothetical protein